MLGSGGAPCGRGGNSTGGCGNAGAFEGPANGRGGTTTVNTRSQGIATYTYMFPEGLDPAVAQLA